MSAKYRDDETSSPSSDVIGWIRRAPKPAVVRKKRKRIELSLRRERRRKMLKHEKNDPNTAIVKFGSVEVNINLPIGEVSHNIKIGQYALARAIKGIVTPGVKIEVAKGVPLYHADPQHPGKIIREVGGRHAVGTFVNGKFRLSR